MYPYICITHAVGDRAETERFTRLLAGYGFRYRTVGEDTTRAVRATMLGGATVLIALTSPEAAATETVAADLARARERGLLSLCLSLSDNSLDDRFCGQGEAILIPYPIGQNPDRHAMDLFVHRLFVRHLSRYKGCFSSILCATDAPGAAVAHAVRARAGDPAACYALGCAYATGRGVPLLENEAAAWIARAAEGGLSDAYIHLGLLRLCGRGIEPDAEGAVTLFSRASAAGDARGDYHAGLCYLDGQGVVRDPVEAVRRLTLSARRHYPPALYRLGLLYRDGLGTTADPRRALHCFYLACLAADRKAGTGTPALYQCLPKHGVCISVRTLRRRVAVRRGLTDSAAATIHQNAYTRCRITAIDRPTVTVALPPVSPAVEGMDPPVAAASAAALATLMMTPPPAAQGRRPLVPHPTRALTWYRYAYRRGDVGSLCQLGDAYRLGRGVPADPAEAVHLYRMSAETGDERGCFSLGVAYEQGLAVDPDMTRAVRLYEQAANAGYPPAQNNLGGCYEHGLGVVQSPVVATEWYARAADAGQPDALCRLGRCYESGRGVPADLARACSLYEVAAEAGHPYAQYRLGLCLSRGVYPADRTSSAPMSSDTVQTPAYTRAVRLWTLAAGAGVADAAYALSLCYAYGRGVSRDVNREIEYLMLAAGANTVIGGSVGVSAHDLSHGSSDLPPAAARYSIQASYALGLCYLEGRGTVRSEFRAVDYFTRAVALWRARCERDRRPVRATDAEPLPADALSPMEAAGDALYMLGYCTLHAVGEEIGRRARSAASACPERVERAVAFFHEAADLDHAGALTALGDLYAYGLLEAATATAEDEALRYYVEAARIAARYRADSARSVGDHPSPEHVDPASPIVHVTPATDQPRVCAIPALMSLAAHSLRVADERAAEGDVGAAEMARVQAWKCLAGSAEQGSADALVEMARCAYLGYGTTAGRDAAPGLLRQAEHSAGGRIAASLWLGDCLRCGWSGDSRPEEADEAYLRALSALPVESEGGVYTVSLRRERRLASDRRARAEVLYRIASFRSAHFADDPQRGGTFAYLAEAILLGHDAALDDLARMYAFETVYAAATTPIGRDAAPLSLWDRVEGSRARRRHTRRGASGKHSRVAIRSHHTWMTDYYTALWLEPRPFCYELCSAAVPTDIPAYATASVTDIMRAAALNYLGDCLFYGRGVTADAAAAVTCYRRVVSMKLSIERGQPAPAALTWARYSLGWCLLHGIGAAKDAREAVGLLTLASAGHAEACRTLGECHEQGIGVDVSDDREAIKFYRKAVALGDRRAATKVAELERRLRERA